MLIGTIAFSAPAHAAGPADVREIETFADAFFAEEMGRRHAPGAVFVFVRDGAVVLAKGYGVADRETGRAIDPERTVFRAASVSKLFTATAALQLVEAGRLGLDDDVNEHLSGFRIADTYPEPIRIRHLLTHTAGFDDRLVGISVRERHELPPLGEHVERMMPPRVLPPGAYHSYSNHGMALLGHVVERVSGRSFGQAIEEQILTPLGMHRSSFLPDPALREDLAVGYAWTGDTHRPVRFDWLADAPAGGLVTTGTDIARFMLAHLNDGELPGTKTRILKAETAREMHRQQFTHDPELPGVAFGFHERLRNGQRSIEHAGDLNGFSSLLWLLPEHRMGLFVGYNVGDLVLREDLVAAFLDRYFPVEPPPEPPVLDGAAQRAAALDGYYRWNRHPRGTLDKITALTIRVRPDAAQPGRVAIEFPLGLLETQHFRELAPWRFRREGSGTLIVFDPGDEGRAERVFVGDFGIPFVFDRLAWYEAPQPQVATLGAALVAFIVVALGWPALGALRRRRGDSTRASGAPLPGTARAAAYAASWLGLGFVLGFAGAFSATPVEEFMYGLPHSIAAVLAVGVAAALAVAAWIICAGSLWIRHQGSLGARVLYSTLAVCGGLFVWLLDYWNLLGFRV